MMKTLYTNQSDFTFLKTLKFVLFLFVGLTALPGNLAAAEMEEEMCGHKTLTIFNNGACAVDILLWQAGGDVYYTTLHPCQSWAVNSEEGIKWRAVDADPHWGNLQFDEHYMLNSNCQQDWTITPNYCGGGTCTEQQDVDFLYDCDAGVRVDLYGEGCDGGGATVNIPNPGNVFQTVIEAVYKGCDPGSTIHVNVGGSNITMDKITIPLGRSTDVYLYRTVLDSGISSATHTGVCGGCRNNSGLQSMVAYAFRDLGQPSAATGTLTSVSGYNDVRNFTIPLITDQNSRNVTVEIPVSEVTDDDRHLKITATAGGASSSRTINAPNAGCCLNIVEITIPNVPGNATSVNIELDATAASDNRTPQNAGQSYVIAGIINATSECTGDCNQALTINNNGDCDVELYRWVDGGDIFEANISPGQSVTVATETSLMWRATDAPDPDFNNLLFDASYTSTDECNQVWNINPDYCDLLCTPDCGDNDPCEAIRAYVINDVDPVCEDVTGTGVIFQRECGETFTNWRSNGNLFLYEFADGTANIIGTVTNGNTTAQVDICLDEESSTGTTWTASCYVDRLGAVERFYNCFSGTITYNGTTQTIHKKGNGAGFIIARGAGNEGGGLGLAGWTAGTFASCGEWFSDLQRIDAPVGEAAASNNGPISCTTPNITITALPNGGSYSWSGPGGFTSNQQSPQVGAAGTYTVTVTNSDGCIATAETVVEADDAAPNATASNNGPICNGDVIEISASSTTANVSYTWVGEGLNANQTTSQNNTITGLAPGSYDYTVTVTNLDNGCTAEATTTVVVIANPDSGISAQDQVCAGEEAQFSAVPAVNGATYDWTFSGPATPATSDQPVVDVIWADVPGDYLATLVVTKDGCVSTFTHDITVTMEVKAIAPPDATICQGGSITLDASDSQGNGYLWSVVTGDPTSLDLGGSSNMATVSPLVTTTYELKVDDGPNGCTKVDAVTIFVDVNFNPIADAGEPATICENGMIMLDGTGSQSPPADPGAPLSYIWSPANLLDDPTSATPKATVSENTEFQLIVAVPNGCSDTSYVDITVAGCDLSLDKVVSDETPNVGDEVTFTVTVTNEGSLAVGGITVRSRRCPTWRIL